MKRAILLLIFATTCFFVNAQKQVLYLPTVNQTEILNAADVRWVYQTPSGCNVQVGGSGTRIINSTLSFSAIKDSLGRNFGQVTQRYATGGTINSRPALVSLRHVRNILTKSGVTTIQINDPNQDYGVYETIAQLQEIVGYPIGDGSGVTGGGIITPDTLYIVNDGGGTNPDTIIIDLSSLADGNGIFGVPDTVPSGMIATIDSGITFQGLQPTTFFNVDMDQGLFGTDYLQNDDTLKFRFYDLGSDSWLVADAAGIEIHSDGPDKIVLDGAVRITDLVTDPAIKLVGTDNDGDLSSLVLGSNLAISGDTLNATGGSGATDLSFSGASSPVTLNSSTGTDVTITAGTGISLAATGTDITITNSNPTPGVTGAGLANRLGVWQASGVMGYESTLLVDSVNNRIKIGDQVAPTYKLHLAGTYTADATLTPAGAMGIFSTIGLNSPTANAVISGINNSPTFAAATGTNPTASALYFNPTFPAGYARYNAIRILPNSRYSGLESSAIHINCSSSNGLYIDGSASRALAEFNTSNNSTVMLSTLNSFDNTTMNFQANRTSTTVGVYNGIALAVKPGGESFNAVSVELGAVLEVNSAGNSKDGLFFARRSGGVRTESGRFSGEGNFLIGHTTDANARLDVNSIGTTSASDAANFANSLDSTILHVRSDRRVGINTTTPDVSLDAGENTDQIKLPGGTTAQRAAVNNSIRYNSDAEGFEAREGGTWYRLTSSKTPAVTVGAGLGTGGTVSCVGNDLGGTVVFTTGTSAVAGDLFTLTFANAFDPAAQVTTTFSAKSTSAAVAMTTMYIGVEGTTYFTLTSASALPDGTTHTINYKISQ